MYEDICLRGTERNVSRHVRYLELSEPYNGPDTDQLDFVNGVNISSREARCKTLACLPTTWQQCKLSEQFISHGFEKVEKLTGTKTRE